MMTLQLGQRLRELREYHHYTQEYISSKLNIERPSYSNYECGKRTPPLDILIKLADFYHISIDNLLCDPKFSPCAATDEFAPTSISKEEKYFLRFYRLLSEDDRREILHFMQFRLQNSDL